MNGNLTEEKTIKKQIIADLSREEKSISGLHKSLEDQGIVIHRLVLTGYLRALVDVGYLKEKEIKPSRIYSVLYSNHQDIYEIVGTASRIYDEESAGDNALRMLFFLFNRPLFLREMERCGVELPRNYKRVTPQKRMEYIEKLGEAGIKIPASNMMMEPLSSDSNATIKILREMINLSLDLKRYVVSLPDYSEKTLD
jgi:hypothetical protein